MKERMEGKGKEGKRRDKRFGEIPKLINTLHSY
jgi:hypothetical protein